MKKIPTLFERLFNDHKIVGITSDITPGCEEAFLHGEATIKYDGSCCALINGHMYKRYDAKKGKKIPEGAIPCCDPDPITGHHPHWVEVNPDNPADKWFWDAFVNGPDRTGKWVYEAGTYEAIGPHFQGNPYNLPYDIIVRHGVTFVNVERTFEGVKNWLENNPEEGLVFWLNDEPVCKIKRSDFGLPWNNKR